MGSRANVVVRENESQVWLYCHWSGSSYVDKTRAAIAKRWRWTDAPYLARIIFDTLTEGHQGDETGFGITTRITDNEYPVLVVDCTRKQVYFVQENELDEEGRVPVDYRPVKAQSFADFAACEAAED